MIRARWWLPLVGMLAAGGAAAQTSGADQGTWFAVGAGGGWARVACTICSSERDLGPAGHLRLGTGVRPGLLVSAEASVWTHTGEADVRESIGTLAAVGTVYPRPGGPLYLKGGAGYVALRAGDDLAANLFGLLVGAGYEFAVGDGLSITNDLSLVASSFGTLRNGDATAADDVSVTVLQFGIGLRRR